MMKKILFVSVALCAPFFASAQSLELIAGGGGYTEDTGGSVAWSIGEPVIATYEGTSMHVTQGFHQSDIYVVSVERFEEVEIAVFPNPTTDYINITADKAMQMSVYDMSGKLVGLYSIAEATEQIDISELSRGTYNLVFEAENKIVQTIKILKQ